MAEQNRAEQSMTEHTKRNQTMALPPPPELEAPFEFEEAAITTLSSSYSLSSVGSSNLQTGQEFRELNQGTMQSP
ncbi:hypothetical protein GmHk_20G058002 [Glycine max]|uniref:Uncharacterized protein n=1 Tax=Glycine soja TaxID=3848 RepID=A0A0B2QTG3_GLYSO|nr:hypothetical protein GmHk_20G058002 [Glycine max]KHN23113.1 hypothetical protein glysoja_030173 [Glycine soja]